MVIKANMVKSYLVSILNPETGAVLLPPTIYHGRNEVMESLSEFFLFKLHPNYHVPISHFRSGTLPERYHYYIHFREVLRTPPYWDTTVTFTLPPVAWNVIDTMVSPLAALPPLPEPPLGLAF